MDRPVSVFTLAAAVGISLAACSSSLEKFAESQENLKGGHIATVELVGWGRNRRVRSQSYLDVGEDVLNLQQESLLLLNSWSTDHVTVSLFKQPGMDIPNLDFEQPRLARMAEVLASHVEPPLQVDLVVIPKMQSFTSLFESDSTEPVHVRLAYSQTDVPEVETGSIEKTLHELFHLLDLLEQPPLNGIYRDLTEEEALATAWAECMTRDIAPSDSPREWPTLPAQITDKSTSPEEDARKVALLRNQSTIAPPIGRALAADAMWNIYLESGLKAQQLNRIENMDITCKGILDGDEAENFLVETYRSGE